MPTVPKAQWEYTPLGRALHYIGTPERIGTELVGAPLAKQLMPSAAERIETLQREQSDVYMGDVYNAMFPLDERYPSPMKKLGRALIGGALGAAVDPLAYLQIGGLTKAGRAAARTGKLVEGAARQARTGQRAALSVGIPFTGAKTAILPKRASEGLYKASEALRAGHVAERAAQVVADKLPILNEVGLPKVGRFWDTLTTTVGQKFGFHVGADLWLQRTQEELFSKITGHGRRIAEAVTDDLEPFLDVAARRFSSQLDIPVEDAYAKFKLAVTEAMDMHPEIAMAKDAETGKMLFQRVPFRSEYEKARASIATNFGLPPSFGGPASLNDTSSIRRVRHLVLKRRRYQANVLAQDEERLGKQLALVTHPDAWYSGNFLSQEAQDFFRTADLRAMKGTLIGGKGRAARAYLTPPASHIGNEIARTTRLVDPDVLQEYLREGVIGPIRIAGKEVDPAPILKAFAGKPATKRVRRLINAMIDEGRLSLDPEVDNYVGRLLPAIPKADFNRYVFENGWGKLIPKGKIQNFFELDPTIMDVQRGMRSDRAMLSKEWFDAIKVRGTDPSKPWEKQLVHALNDPNMPSDWVPVEGIQELQGFAMHPDEAKYMANWYQADVNTGPHLKKFIKLVDYGNQNFKAWTLSIFPSYHTRNFFSNMWNYYLGSENPLDAMTNLQLSHTAWESIRPSLRPWGARAAKARAWKLKGTVNPATGKEWTAEQIWQGVADCNGWGVGFISPEDPGNIRRNVQHMKRHAPIDPERQLLKLARENWKAGGKVGKPYIGPPRPEIAERIKLGLLGEHPWVESGFRFGSYVDDRIRMSHVLQKLRQGNSIDEAVQSMKKVFFDYTQLSPFEKQWMKRVFPFYSWSRKNIPFQLEMMVRRPDRIQRFHGGLQAWESAGEVPPEEKYLNEWMRKRFSVRVRRNKWGKNEYFAFGGWLPLADIQEIFHATDWLTQSLTPWARIPVEQMSNINHFTDRKIDYMNSLTKGERTRFGTGRGVGLKGKGVAVPNRVAHILKSVRITNTLHQIIDNPQELDYYTQLGRVVAGRIYPLDVGRSRYQFQQELLKLQQSTRKAIRSAVFAGDMGARQRLVEEYTKQHAHALARRGM